jgi:hypothetical protein
MRLSSCPNSLFILAHRPFFCTRQALFAIGNLANSIRGARKGGMFEASLVFQVCIEVEKAMQDSNDKVSGETMQ